jgi:CBS domain-containing protein
MQNLKAKDIMTKDIVIVTEDMSVKEVADLFTKKRIGGAPVLRDKKIVGIISDDDLIMQDVRIHFPTYIQFLDGIIYLESWKRFEEELKKAVGAKVSDVMTTNVITAGADDSVEDIATTMVDKHINRIPVIENGELVGIITKGDIVKAISRS